MNSMSDDMKRGIEKFAAATAAVAQSLPQVVAAPAVAVASAQDRVPPRRDVGPVVSAGAEKAVAVRAEIAPEEVDGPSGLESDVEVESAGERSEYDEDGQEGDYSEEVERPSDPPDRL